MYVAGTYAHNDMQHVCPYSGYNLINMLTINWLMVNIHGAIGDILSQYTLLRLVVIFILTVLTVIAGWRLNVMVKSVLSGSMRI